LIAGCFDTAVNLTNTHRGSSNARSNTYENLILIRAAAGAKDLSELQSQMDDG